VKVGKTLVLNVYSDTFNQVVDHYLPSQLLTQAVPAPLSSCNRFKAQRVAEQEVSTARRNMEQEYVRAAEEDQRQKKEKFMHYYERYSNHLNSLEVSHQRSRLKKASHNALVSAWDNQTELY